MMPSQPQRRLHPVPKPLARRVRMAAILLPMHVAPASTLSTTRQRRSCPQPAVEHGKENHIPPCGSRDGGPPGSCRSPGCSPRRPGPRGRRAGSARCCLRRRAALRSVSGVREVKGGGENPRRRSSPWIRRCRGRLHARCPRRRSWREVSGGTGGGEGRATRWGRGRCYRNLEFGQCQSGSIEEGRNAARTMG